MLMSFLGCLKFFSAKILKMYIYNSRHVLRICDEAIGKAGCVYCIIKLSCELGIFLQFQIKLLPVVTANTV